MLVRSLESVFKFAQCYGSAQNFLVFTQMVPGKPPRSKRKRIRKKWEKKERLAIEAFRKEHATRLREFHLVQVDFADLEACVTKRHLNRVVMHPQTPICMDTGEPL